MELPRLGALPVWAQEGLDAAATYRARWTVGYDKISMPFDGFDGWHKGWLWQEDGTGHTFWHPLLQA